MNRVIIRAECNSSQAVIGYPGSNMSQHAPGAKLDSGKLRPYLVHSGFVNAFEEVYKAGTAGAAKYSDYGWHKVPNGIHRYLDAHGRHLSAYMRGEDRDSETTAHHLGAAAWNLLGALELILEESNRETE